MERRFRTLEHPRSTGHSPAKQQPYLQAGTCVKRVCYAARGNFEHMCINHRGTYFTVGQQFLNRADMTERRFSRFLRRVTGNT